MEPFSFMFPVLVSRPGLPAVPPHTLSKAHFLCLPFAAFWQTGWLAVKLEQSVRNSNSCSRTSLPRSVAQETRELFASLNCIFHNRRNRDVDDLLLNPFRRDLLLGPLTDSYLWNFFYFHLFLHRLKTGDVPCRLSGNDLFLIGLTVRCTQSQL